jgi:hypothetical protein
MNISGTVTVQTEDGNIIRTLRYNLTQIAKVHRNGENESYNLEGATEEAKRQMSRWEQSDQFIGRKLIVAVD